MVQTSQDGRGLFNSVWRNNLRSQQEQLNGERSQLLAKNEQARTRVEAMIARLKSLEQHT